MQEDKMLQELAEVLKSLPAPPKMVHAGDKVLCVCGEWAPLTEVSIVDTGVVKALNNVRRGCAACEKEDKLTAKLVCVRCKTVVARMKPHKDKDGFVYVAGRAYHLDGCPSCVEGLEYSSIVEKKIYEKNMGVK